MWMGIGAAGGFTLSKLNENQMKQYAEMLDDFQKKTGISYLDCMFIVWISLTFEQRRVRLVKNRPDLSMHVG